MICGGMLDFALKACLSFILLFEMSSDWTAAETMCQSQEPIDSPKMLTTYDYPVMVTASQCRCIIIPSQTIEEFNIQVILRRSDRTSDCSRTQMTIVNRNHSDTVCPYPYTSDQDDFVMTESLTLTTHDRPVITLWNTHLELISAQVTFKSEIPVAYSISCTELGESLIWPFDDQGLGYDDGVDPGIKVAVVVLFFVLSVLISFTIRLIMRLRWRKLKLQKRRQQARLSQSDQLKQAGATANIGFSCTSVNHLSNSLGSFNPVDNQSYFKVSQNVIPVNGSTNWSNASMPKGSNHHLTGQGSIWPYNDEQITAQQTSSRQVPPMYNDLLFNTSSSSPQMLKTSMSRGSVEPEQKSNRQSSASEISIVHLQLIDASRSANNASNSFESGPTVHAKSRKQVPLHHKISTPVHRSQPEKGRPTDQASDCLSFVENSNQEKGEHNHKTLPDESIHKLPKYKKQLTDDVKGVRINHSTPDFVPMPMGNGSASTSRGSIMHESEI